MNDEAEPKIINDYPPNWDKVKQIFPVEDAEVVMAYGGNIYNPFNLQLRDDVIFHETIHLKQQKRAQERGMNMDEWWDRYATNIEARIEFEAQAYGQQVAYIRRRQGEERALKALKSFSNFLSGPVYGNAITQEKAFEKIRRVYKQNYANN